MGRVHGDELQSKRRDAGKDGKFGTFCSVVINSKSLSTFLTRIRQYSLELYVIDQAFLYDNSAIVFMEQMCRILENQDINVDYSLYSGHSMQHWLRGHDLLRESIHARIGRLEV